MSLVKLNNKFILAFPGTGKTPLSLKNPRYRDTDFGTLRVGLNYSKEEDAKLAPIFTSYLSALDRDVKGKDVVFMSNEPLLMKFIHVDHVYLPVHPEFSARKMSVPVETIREWVQGWEEQANKLGIPVTYVSGLDKYLR